MISWYRVSIGPRIACSRKCSNLLQYNYIYIHVYIYICNIYIYIHVFMLYIYIYIYIVFICGRQAFDNYNHNPSPANRHLATSSFVQYPRVIHAIQISFPCLGSMLCKFTNVPQNNVYIYIYMSNDIQKPHDKTYACWTKTLEGIQRLQCPRICSQSILHWKPQTFQAKYIEKKQHPQSILINYFYICM